MIVCINSKNRIRPSIEYVNYDWEDEELDLERYGQIMKQDYDEVYIINFHSYMASLIKEIRKHGKKL